MYWWVLECITRSVSDAARTRFFFWSFALFAPMEVKYSYTSRSFVVRSISWRGYTKKWKKKKWDTSYVPFHSSWIGFRVKLMCVGKTGSTRQRINCVLCLRGARVARLIELFIINFIAKLQSAPLITTTLWPIVPTQANAIIFDLFKCDWELRWNVWAQLRASLWTDAIILLRQCRRTCTWFWCGRVQKPATTTTTTNSEIKLLKFWNLFQITVETKCISFLSELRLFSLCRSSWNCLFMSLEQRNLRLSDDKLWFR